MAKLTLRLPQSLKERIQRLSEEEGVSMNQLITLAVAEKAALLEAGGHQRKYLEARAARARKRAGEHDQTPADSLRALLEHVPDVEPAREEDRLSPR